MNKKIINLTPHKLVFFLNQNLSEKIALESVGSIRISESREVIGHIQGIPVHKKFYSNVQEDQLQRIYRYINDDNVEAIVVSVIVAKKLKEMGIEEKIYYPDDLVRDEKGFVIGCKSLAKA